MAKKNQKPQGVLVQKPRTTIYTSLLILAFLALSLGCILMWLERSKYF